MAIDDNTTYGLTGAQVKELPEKINAVKGLAKELTADDYDYPTDNPTSIAAWSLAPGLYTAGEHVSIKRNTSATMTTTAKKNFIILNGPGSTYKTIVDFSAADGINTGLTMYYVSTSGVSAWSRRFLISDDIVNNLTSTAVAYPLSANQGKVLKGLIDAISQSGAGAPTTSTVGTVGQLYQDTTNGKLYICTDATNPYVWEEVGAGGGGGPTVVQTTGTSTTDVMSQNAATSLVYGGLGAGVGKTIKIGSTSTTSSTGDRIAISYTANASGDRGIAIGRGATASGTGAIALGTASTASAAGEMNIGTSNTSYGYSSSNYRLLTGLYDGQSAHDAATKGQLDSLITLTDTDPGEGSPLAAGKFIAVY